MSPKKPQKIRIAANGYRLCDPLPKGEQLIDSTKNQWILGTPIGSGGFGDIYSCRRKGDRTDDFVIKLDNINGPLFQEMNFYLRVAKPEQINGFMSKHKRKFLGMPPFIATGIHDKSSASTNKRNNASNQSTLKKNAPTIQYRFLVMQRFGDQLEDWVKDKKLKTPDAIDVAVKMIDVLEYIHSFGYIHADIKGTNILKSRKAGKVWYLVDFGLAERYCDPNGRHRDEKPDKKRANNGTVEYRSRDAHVGQLSRRSDIECLAYNLIQWLYGSLPWMSSLKDAKKVEKLKEDFFENLDQSLRKCFRKSVPNGLKAFFKMVEDMEYDSQPNYKKLKDSLLKILSKPNSSHESDDEEEEEDEEEDEEVLRKVSHSSSESTVDTLRMNTPLKEHKTPNKSKNQQTIEKRTNKRKTTEIVELSDSEDSTVMKVAVSPPKRSRSLRNTPRNGGLASDLLSPNRRSNRKPVPRFSTPLLFADEDEDYSPEKESPVLNSSGSGGDSMYLSALAEKEMSPNETPAMKQMRRLIKAKSPECEVIPNETPAMREMRERIKQKASKKQPKKKK